MPFSKIRQAVLLSLALTAAPCTTHAAILLASDGAAYDNFGYSASQSGGIGLISAPYSDGTNSDQGSAYVFRDLDTATGTITQSEKLTASDGMGGDQFGSSVSLSGNIALVGSQAAKVGQRGEQGSAYVFRNLNSATGPITEDVKLTASDGAISDYFGNSVSLSGSLGLVGARYDDSPSLTSDVGSAYVFRGLNTATGTIMQAAKLTASDGVGGDQLGSSVSLSGNIGLVGAQFDDIGYQNQGSAYVFRNLDTAIGLTTQNVKLTASDGAEFDSFGASVSLSGSIGLVGSARSAYLFRDLNTATGIVSENVRLIASDGTTYSFLGSSVSLSNGTGLVGATGGAYVFRNLDTAIGTITQNVKLIASDGVGGFGSSVSINGDQYTIGASGKNSSTGKAYTGSVSSVTTLDTGNTSKVISGISFVSQDNWEIGVTTDANQVTLSAGDTANVTASGKAVYIGKTAGSDNNTLIINGSLIANAIYVGAAGNTGNQLIIGETGTVSGSIIFAGATTAGGDGTITGDLTLVADSKFIFDLTSTLTVTGSVSLDTTFGIDDLVGLDSSVANGTYTLIDGTATNFSTLGIENWGADNAYYLGGGKSAYFSQGSLKVEVVPEPSTYGLIAGAGVFLFFLRRRRVSANEVTSSK